MCDPRLALSYSQKILTQKFRESFGNEVKKQNRQTTIKPQTLREQKSQYGKLVRKTGLGSENRERTRIVFDSKTGENETGTKNQKSASIGR